MSYWNEKFTRKNKPNILDKDEKVDVCIIGGGLTGLTTAYYLSKSNLKVAILESNEICSGTSGSTTGKITSQHGLFYSYLIKSYGIDFAKKYFEANELAISNIEKITKDENIECDFVRQTSCVFCDKESEKKEFGEEMNALNRLKVNAIYKEKVDIPINNFGGIEFENQAMFNPVKYAYGLLDILENNGVRVYENSKVIKINKENGNYIVYTNNHSVKCKYVVIATHFPIKDFPGMYFAKMYQDISYVIAVKSDKKYFGKYYINNSSPSISIRTITDYGKDNITLIAGNGHRVGRNINKVDSYKFLEDIAKKIFGSNFTVIDKWSTQDCISMDKIPYIGKFSSLMSNIYVATGFNKWGMALSNVASNIISDDILGKENKYKNLFTATRMDVIKNMKAYSEHMKETVYSIAINKFKIPKEYLDDVKEGEGKIISYKNNKVGVYKDEDGKFNFIKPICTHLKCELQFNNIDKTWDCPCHGSRFTVDGEVINNPAVINLDNDFNK